MKIGSEKIGIGKIGLSKKIVWSALSVAKNIGVQSNWNWIAMGMESDRL
jgi:hypothetical protein